MDKQTLDDLIDDFPKRDREILNLILQGYGGASGRSTINRTEITEKMKLTGKGKIPDDSHVSHALKRFRLKFGLDKEDGIEELLDFFYDVDPNYLSEKANKKRGSSACKPEPISSYARLKSPFYIPRDRIDNQALNLVRESGILLRIKAAKQLGKTSLIKRIEAGLKAEKRCVLYINLSLLEDTFESHHDAIYQRFLRSFTEKIYHTFSKQTSLSLELGKWDNPPSPNDKCTDDFDLLLEQTDNPLVLIIDNVDCIFKHEQVYKFFSELIRDWYESSIESENWEKLSIVLSYSTEAYGKLDINKSPFNIGEVITFNDLNQEQVQKLASLHGLATDCVEPIMNLVGGHPYLVRLAMYKAVNNYLPIQEIIQDAANLSGIYREHLERHQETLESNQDLNAAFKLLITNKAPMAIKEKKIRHQLEGMGLIKIRGNLCEVKYKLYQLYFSDYFQ